MTLKVDRANRSFALVLLLVTALAASLAAIAVLSFNDDAPPKQLPFAKRFVLGVDNAFFPLDPGDSWLLKGEDADGKLRERVTVLDGYEEIEGVKAVVVKDVAYLNGELHEKTWDWYAQDAAGNVWYFGEDTAEYEDGKKVSEEGSWKHGVDGAHAGLFMPAEPELGMAGMQEGFPGEAEDMFWVLDRAKVTVPAGKFKQALRVLEFNPLDPRVFEVKYYGPGVGLLSEQTITGPEERVELVKAE